jgi:O-acetyl-ADP-ribose deacetylase (regulator of RNase III)
MTLNTHSGNLMDVTHGIIVHGCNARGVMGAGVAKEVKARFPGAFTAYRKKYEGGSLELGSVVWFIANQRPKLAIANAITQLTYGRDPKQRYVDYEAIAKSFDKVAAVARLHNLPVHYPKVGASLGGGDWDVIAPIIARSLEGVDAHLWVLPVRPTLRP